MSIASAEAAIPPAEGSEAIDESDPLAARTADEIKALEDDMPPEPVTMSREEKTAEKLLPEVKNISDDWSGAAGYAAPLKANAEYVQSLRQIA